MEIAPLSRRLWRFCAEYVLGTRLEVLVVSGNPASAWHATVAARAEIERLNQVFNRRLINSEISRLQRLRQAVASVDLFTVLQLSEIWRHLSLGAFDGRVGALLQLWAGEADPPLPTIQTTLAALRGATIELEQWTHWVKLSRAIDLSLDAVAKGYIVDAAVKAARRTVPTLEGIAINIGGEIRCWGESPSPCGWPIGIPDPMVPAENAALIDAVYLRNASIATSGLGPRDLRQAGYRSTTISPYTGYPVRRVISASVVASHAADADAMATACMVLDPEAAIGMVDRLAGAAARITEVNGRVHQSRGWPTLQDSGQSRLALKASSKRNQALLATELRWPSYWELAVSYSASGPGGYPSNLMAAELHDPYIAVWITDAQNRPIITLLLLGTDLRWTRENFIWWDSWKGREKKEVYSRSRPTTRSGQYDMEWLGVDEDLNPVPIGKYLLHFETSQEHGKHTYRSIPIEIGRQQFQLSIQDLDGMGSLDIAYKPYITPSR